MSSYVSTTVPTTPRIVESSTTEKEEMMMPVEAEASREPLFDRVKLNEDKPTIIIPLKKEPLYPTEIMKLSNKPLLDPYSEHNPKLKLTKIMKLRDTFVDRINYDKLEVPKEKKAKKIVPQRDELFKQYLKKVFGSEEDISGFMGPGMKQSHLYKTFLKDIDTFLPNVQEHFTDKKSEESVEVKNSLESISNTNVTVKGSLQSIEDSGSANSIEIEIPTTKTDFDATTLEAKSDKSEQNIGEEQSEKENKSEKKKMLVDYESENNEPEDEDVSDNNDLKQESISKDNNNNHGLKVSSKESDMGVNLAKENPTIRDESDSRESSIISWKEEKIKNHSEQTQSSEKSIRTETKINPSSNIKTEPDEEKTNPIELRDMERIILEQQKAFKALGVLERHLNSADETSREIKAAKSFADRQIKLAEKQVAAEKKSKLLDDED